MRMKQYIVFVLGSDLLPAYGITMGDDMGVDTWYEFCNLLADGFKRSKYNKGESLYDELTDYVVAHKDKILKVLNDYE